MVITSLSLSIIHKLTKLSRQILASDTFGGCPPGDDGFGVFFGIFVHEDFCKVGTVTDESVTFAFGLGVRKGFASRCIDEETGLLTVACAESEDG
jgi:hypothetical protein